MTTVNSCNYTSAAPINVANGGTGLTTATTAYGVVCAGTTATGVLQVLSALGNAGNVLTSNGAGALPSFQAAGGVGSIVQVVQAIFTGTTAVATATFTDTGITATITPAVNTHKILVIGQISLGDDNSTDNGAGLQIVGGNTSTFLGAAAGSRIQVAGGSFCTSTGLITIPMMYLDSPATNAAVTYKFQLARIGAAGTVYVNRSVDDSNNSSRVRAASSIILLEVVA